jgi:glycolate oxidase FAD binding subunit
VDLMNLEGLCGTIASAVAVVAVGARTQWDVGGRLARDCVEVEAPAGIVTYEPDDLTITVGAGTRCADLRAALAEHGQECPLDPRDDDATIGGIFAAGLSGPRRLRHGPLRDQALEVRFVTADGRLVKGGGPTVKNVTGYDLVRLLTGSLGTLGVLTQLTLRCRPRAEHARWVRVDDELPAFFRPSSLLWNGEHVDVLLEGAETDVESQAAGRPASDGANLPDGPHRGRISVAPARVRDLGEALRALDGLRWAAELGVGTVHVAAESGHRLREARAAAHDHDGWMLREAGGDADDDGFGRPLPNLDVMRRIKRAFDPDGKLSPGRLPL